MIAAELLKEGRGIRLVLIRESMDAVSRWKGDFVISEAVSRGQFEIILRIPDADTQSTSRTLES